MSNKSTGLLKSGIIVSAAIVLVKIIGLLKQTVIAWYFGATAATDVYFIADGFIGPLNVVIFSSISVVVISEYMREKRSNHQNSLISNLHIVHMGITVLLVAGIWVLAPYLAQVIAIGYSDDTLQEVVRYLRILSLILGFYCIASVSGAVLEGEKHFLPTKFQGLFVSVSVIAAAVLFGNSVGIDALLYGTIAGYFFYMLSNLICARRWLHFSPQMPFRDKRIWKIIRLSIPLLIGNAMNDVSMIVDKMIASGLGEGAVSDLYYSQVISNDLVSAVFVTSIGTVFYSYFAGYVAEDEIGLVGKTIAKGINYLLVILSEIMILYFLSSEKLIDILFNHGSFTAKDVTITSMIAIGYASGFIAMAVREIYIKAHYSFQDTRIPMINGLVGTGLNIVISIFCTSKIGIVGIAIGTSTSYFITAALSIITIRRHIAKIDYGAVKENVWKILVAATGSAGFLIGWKSFLTFDDFFIWIAGCVLSIVVYIGILKLLKCSVIDHLFNLKKGG